MTNPVRFGRPFTKGVAGVVGAIGMTLPRVAAATAPRRVIVYVPAAAPGVCQGLAVPGSGAIS